MLVTILAEVPDVIKVYEYRVVEYQPAINIGKLCCPFYSGVRVMMNT